MVTIENVPTVGPALHRAGSTCPQFGYLLLVNAILLVLGCLLEGTTILLVIVPILIPTAKALGIDLVHFGVVVVVNIMIGLLTPPFGLLLFVVANMTKQPLMAIVARGGAVHPRGDRRSGDHHVRAGDGSVAAAGDRLQGLSAGLQ